jgi:hypothetical protein
MTIDTLAIAWADQPDFTDDQSNDYTMRGGYAVEPIARRNRSRGMQAECGHCGTILDTAHDLVHVESCEREHRPYRYGAA